MVSSIYNKDILFSVFNFWFELYIWIFSIALIQIRKKYFLIHLVSLDNIADKFLWKPQMHILCKQINLNDDRMGRIIYFMNVGVHLEFNFLWM